jgi:drug/metabolite transporter (DMT)-like permease
MLALAAGIAWGITALLIRTTGLAEAPPAQTLFFQLLISRLLLSLAALLLKGNFTLPHTRQS